MTGEDFERDSIPATGAAPATRPNQMGNSISDTPQRFNDD